MQIHRLTEIVFILLKNEKTAAKELAEKFEVSARTIYRDIEVLSAAGVPIFTEKGNGGGISIAKSYRLNNAILSETEKQEMLTMLTAYSATTNSATSSNLLNKLSSIFHTANDIIEVDFSDWQNDDSVQKAFNVVKDCIIGKIPVQIVYCNSNGDEQTREIEPLKLLFKHRAWYVYAYCRIRKENRLFKLARIYDIRIMKETFDRVFTGTTLAKQFEWKCDNYEVVLKIDKSMKNRVLEEFYKKNITDSDGNYIVTTSMPLDEWITGFVLSYGDKVKVISPEFFKQKIKDIHRRACEMQ